MGIVITDEEVAYLQSLSPLHELKPLTRQQEQLLLYYFRGASIAAAARSAGYQSVATARKLLESEQFKVYIDYLRDREFQEVKVNRDILTRMLFEAHDIAATSHERISAIRELGKMHDVYPKEGNAPTVVINQVTEGALKQMERMSDAELMQLAGSALLEHQRNQEAIEGEFSEVDDD